MSANRVLPSKYLYLVAVQHAASPGVYASGIAVSLLQDAVESMLVAVSSAVGAKTSGKTSFDQYWSAIDAADLNKKLTFRQDMMRLNNARVGFKHYGVLHSESELEHLFPLAHRFLVDTARVYFDVDFDGVSETDLIGIAAVRGPLQEAERIIANGLEIREAGKLLSIALATLEGSLRVHIPLSPGQMPHADALPAQIREVADWLQMQLNTLAAAARLNALNVNPADLFLLRTVLPRQLGGDRFEFPGRSDGSPRLTVDTAREAIRIITRMAMQLDSLIRDYHPRAATILYSGTGGENVSWRREP